MRKKKQKLTRIETTNSNDGFNNLIDRHTHALEENSLKIVKALKALSKKDLKSSELEALKKIKNSLKKIDKGIDKL